MVEPREPSTAQTNETLYRFLDRLGQVVAGATSADEILAVTTRETAQHLELSNCAYADMDEDEDGFTIRGNWHSPGSPSIVGHYKLADFGELAVQELSAGRPLIINDNLKEIAPHEAKTFQDIGIAATICMPLVQGKRLVALMAIHDKQPHQWSDYELTVIREVTARSWAHVQRVGAEAELRASEERLRALTRAMPNQAWTARPDGLLDWFNEQVYDYAGAKPGGLDGTGWTSMVHRDDVPAAQERWAASIATGETYETEFRLRRKDGQWRWHIARAVPVHDEFGRVTQWIGTNTDIHDQKEISQVLEQRVEERTSELLEAQGALRQAQKMEAVGQLTGGIAHDFNNLLMGISGSLEIIEKRIAEGKLSGIERYIDGAQGASRRAAALTQRLLAFSRRQALDPRPTDVNRLIQGMEDLVRRTIGTEIELEVVGAGGLWTTLIDPAQLESSLLNLCINARDAMMPGGGRLTIETANKWLDEREARARDLPAGQYISLCVTDTGTGMTASVAERAFDPFFTTKPLGQGTGLGLSMIYGFVRQSGGQVRIYTEVGQGTTMCLYLPRFKGKDTTSTDLEAQSQPLQSSAHGETVLVIDDDPLVRELVVDTLRDQGYLVSEADNGPAGLNLIETAEFDLVITDVGLPGGMNGRQVADAARTIKSEIKVLFITGYAENAVVGNGHLEPWMHLMTKPFLTSALSNKVREIIDGL